MLKVALPGSIQLLNMIERYLYYEQYFRYIIPCKVVDLILVFKALISLFFSAFIIA